MMTIGLILLLAGMVTIFLYMFIHSLNLSKNRLIIAFAVIGFAAGNRTRSFNAMAALSRDGKN